MMHEFKNIVNAYRQAKLNALKAVLATVVDLDGSSYRKPGVRMLILENDEMVGAVSGGCVEKEVLRQAQSVFKDGKSKMMTYDGRYRLGCEGVIYILLEEFKPEDDFIEKFNIALENRESLKIESNYRREEGVFAVIGSMVKIGDIQFPLSQLKGLNNSIDLFKQEWSRT